MALLDNPQDIANGVQGAANEVQSAANGVQGATNGVQGATNGVQGAANEVQSAANGVQGATNGVQSAANGVQGAANGVQSAANGVQGAANGVQGAANGVQGAANGVQGAANGVQGAANGVQGAANGVQGAANGVQGAANGVQGDTNEVRTATNGVQGASINGSLPRDSMKETRAFERLYGRMHLRAMRPWLLLIFLSYLPAWSETPEEAQKLLKAAQAQIGVTTSYDPAYVVLSYPGGDVPEDRGVCTDVVIRAFRSLGLDLQKLVHEDMKRSFPSYPQKWGLRKPDKNIDHRRVPNLVKYFERQGKSCAVSKKATDYRPGDLVTCIVPPNLPHIMIVADAFSSADPERPMIIHNIGQGAKLEDRLFDFEITGHFRYW